MLLKCKHLFLIQWWDARVWEILYHKRILRGMKPSWKHHDVRLSHWYCLASVFVAIQACGTLLKTLQSYLLRRSISCCQCVSNLGTHAPALSTSFSSNKSASCRGCLNPFHIKLKWQKYTRYMKYECQTVMISLQKSDTGCCERMYFLPWVEIVIPVWFFVGRLEDPATLQPWSSVAYWVIPMRKNLNTF